MLTVKKLATKVKVSRSLVKNLLSCGLAVQEKLEDLIASYTSVQFL